MLFFVSAVPIRCRKAQHNFVFQGCTALAQASTEQRGDPCLIPRLPVSGLYRQSNAYDTASSTAQANRLRRHNAQAETDYRVINLKRAKMHTAERKSAGKLASGYEAGVNQAGVLAKWLRLQCQSQNLRISQAQPGCIQEGDTGVGIGLHSPDS